MAHADAESSPIILFPSFYYFIKWRSFIALKTFDENKKKSFRSLEKVLNKCNKLKLDNEFNRICIQNKILPKYTTLKQSKQLLSTICYI